MDDDRPRWLVYQYPSGPSLFSSRLPQKCGNNNFIVPKVLPSKPFLLIIHHPSYNFTIYSPRIDSITKWATDHMKDTTLLNSDNRMRRAVSPGHMLETRPWRWWRQKFLSPPEIKLWSSCPQSVTLLSWLYHLTDCCYSHSLQNVETTPHTCVYI
jgi:hypothetical protein